MLAGVGTGSTSTSAGMKSRRLKSPPTRHLSTPAATKLGLGLRRYLEHLDIVGLPNAQRSLTHVESPSHVPWDSRTSILGIPVDPVKSPGTKGCHRQEPPAPQTSLPNASVQGLVGQTNGGVVTMHQVGNGLAMSDSAHPACVPKGPTRRRC